MRRMVVETLVLALLLGGAGLGPGQQPQPQKRRVEEEEQPRAKPEKAAPKKSRLEDMLAEALRNNPDIRVAAARVNKAEAELQRTRLQVAEKVLRLYHAIEAQQAVVEQAEVGWKRVQAIQRQGVPAISREDMDKAQLQLTLAKAKLAELQAQLPALLGKLPQTASAELLKDAEIARLRAMLEELLRQDRETIRRAAKNAPAQQIVGQVKTVDPSGLITITIGSDAGLAKGHKLFVFRLDPTPSKSKFLGTVRVLEVKPTEAVCQPIGRLTTPIQPNDQVANHILGQ